MLDIRTYRIHFVAGVLVGIAFTITAAIAAADLRISQAPECVAERSASDE